MNDTVDAMEKPFQRYLPEKQESLVRLLEAVAIGRPIWRLVERFYNRRLSTLLPAENAPVVDERTAAVQRRKARARSNRASDRIQFGRKVSFAMRHVADQLRRSGISSSTVRDLVYGRVIGRDGEQRMAKSTAGLILVLGIYWQALGLLVASILVALALGTGGLAAASIAVSGVVTLLWLFAFGHINAIAIRPSVAAMQMRDWSLELQG